MILLHRLNGPPFAINPDLLERVETTPDTVLTLLDGTKYIVVEPVEEVIAAVRDYRASIIAAACQVVDPNAWAQAQLAGQLAHHEGDETDDDATIAPAVPLRRRGRQ